MPRVSADQAITLQGMRFHALVGVLPHEAELPQPLEIDLTVWAPAHPDEIIDYRNLYDAAARVAARRVRYLEEAAEAIAQGALDLDRVVRVRVAVRKPHVALPGPLAYAEVVVERHRRA
ncbi:MAG: hypothetical protein NVS1B4_10930 [Gemmatimonadaceae bacterium]